MKTKFINLRKTSQTIKILVSIMLIFNGITGYAQKTNKINLKQWKEVTSFGSVKQGDLFKLEPIKDTTLIITGSESYSLIPIDFKCHVIKSTTDIKYTTATSIQSSSGLSETNKATKLQTWPVDVKDKNITIYIPLFTKYKGKGLVYFYLIDSNDKCISNIIAWNIEYK
jgi:hypothetical protein